MRLRPFWGRRLRRLLPGVAADARRGPAGVRSAGRDRRRRRASLRGDALASLFDVANWWFILQGSSYGRLFVDPSPVLHFWSLAIEEQFYLVFPLVLVGAVAR